MAAKQVSRFYAMSHSLCPQCRIGKVFTGKVYSFRKQRTNDICPHCGLRFEIEPGYFYAAMYVSYGMVVGQVVALTLITFILTASESPWLYTAVLILAIVLLAPFNFRYSRLILLHYLTPKVKFNPKYLDQLTDGKPSRNDN
ncbi:Protein of unknown function [bacterium A37T11]|nr:Protein of unknown function [bacterium A37T11]